MVLHKLVRRNYGRKLLVSIKYQNLQYFKEGMILLCQSILETRRITHLHGSALFKIPLTKKLNVHHSVMAHYPDRPDLEKNYNEKNCEIRQDFKF